MIFKLDSILKHRVSQLKKLFSVEVITNKHNFEFNTVICKGDGVTD